MLLKTSNIFFPY